MCLDCGDVHHAPDRQSRLPDLRAREGAVTRGLVRRGVTGPRRTAWLPQKGPQVRAGGTQL